MVCFLIYITLLFIQRVYFISSEKKLTIHIVQMFQLLSQAFYNLKMFLMMDMLGVGDAININTNKNIRQVCNYTFGADTFLVVGYKEAEGWVRSFDQRNFADIDAGIIATHMMLEIEDLGLSTTWVGYFDAPRLQSLYPEMKEYHLIALFPIGYAAEDAAPSDRHFKRKKTEEIVKIL